MPTRRKSSPGRGGAWIEGDSMREIRGPSKSGGGWLANNESTPYNLLRCPMRRPQVARESGTAREPRAVSGNSIARPRFVPPLMPSRSLILGNDVQRRASAVKLRPAYFPRSGSTGTGTVTSRRVVSPARISTSPRSSVRSTRSSHLKAVASAATLGPATFS